MRWRTLETAHFRVHFYEEIRHIAERVAFLAERSHTEITRYLDWLPRGRIDITLLDHTDSANGEANSLPRNFINAYAVPPEPLSSLNNFDDWLNVLISHELTHVVHLDTIMGLPRGVDLLFGKIVAPNLVQPNWFIEGLATMMESRLSTAGRIRSSLYDMYLRTAVLENRFHGIARVSNSPAVFPQWEAAYLYGSFFLKYLEDRFGPEKITELSHRYGSRLFPFALNRTAREAFGYRFDQLWEDWQETLRRRFTLQAEEIRRRGLTSATRLTFDARRSGVFLLDGPTPPRFLPDGSGVVSQRLTGDEKPAYFVIDPRTGATRDIAEVHGAHTLSPTPDGQALVFQQVSPFPLPRRVGGADHAGWDELMRLDLRTGHIRALTRGRRLHQPDVSPDGTQIACTVGTIPGTQQLAVVPIEGGEPRVLVPGGAGEIVYSPAWSPSGKHIAFSRAKRGGFHDIHLYDVARGGERPLRVDRAMDLDPRFSPDGRFVLFSSDRSGVYNIYALELASDRLFQVTNVLGGAFQPVLSPDGGTLVFTGFASTGYELFAMPFTPATLALAEPYVTAREDAPAVEPPAGAPPMWTESDYRAWRYLYPRSWGPPTLSRNDLGLGTAVGINLAISDPAALHLLNLAALVPTDGDASLSAWYRYLRFWPSLDLRVSRTAAAAYDLYIDGQQRPYVQHSYTVSGGVSLPVLRRAAASSDLAFSYRYIDYAPADPLPVPDPTQEATIPPEVGPTTDFNVGWWYDNTRGWTRSVSAQKGRRLELNVTTADPAIGSKFSNVQVGWLWREYFTMPWARLHALALLYSGGVGIGDRRTFFTLGGFVQQDLVRSLFYQRPQCCYFLRGYPPGAIGGDQSHLLSAEYRAPILEIESGYSTFPVYLRRIHGAAFADAGNAFFGDFTWSGIRYGVGGELRIDFKLGYYFEPRIQVGVAHGLSKGGITDYYWITSVQVF